MSLLGLSEEFITRKAFSIPLLVFLSLSLPQLTDTKGEIKGYKPPVNLPKTTPFPKRIGSKLIGKIAPDFILDSITGEKYKLLSTRGKVILLDFWHTY